MKISNKLSSGQLVSAAMLLALMIVSQYFKNISPYITGTVVNLCLILCAVFVALYAAVILSIIAPITAFFFTGSPIMAAMPIMFPLIMMGNIIICYFAFAFSKKGAAPLTRFGIGLALGSVIKAAFMGAVCVFAIFPNFSANLANKLASNMQKIAGAATVSEEIVQKANVQAQAVLTAARFTFSVTQLITAALASVLACLMYKPLKTFFSKN